MPLPLDSEIVALRAQFPLVVKPFNGMPLVYFDNAATTHKPVSVIDALSAFYSTFNAPVHRTIYPLGVKASALYEHARSQVADFVCASDDEIIFTRGTTDALNALSYALPSLFSPSKQEIVLSVLEHHSNLLPWKECAQREGLKLNYIPLGEKGDIDYHAASRLITESTALVALTHRSNVLGKTLDVSRVFSQARAHGAYTILDAAQTAGHIPLDVRSLGCDFMTFSAHKMYGPMGIGVLYGRREVLTRLPPFQTGGGMVDSMSLDGPSTWLSSPLRFEAGSPNVSGALGLSASISFLSKVGVERIFEREHALGSYAFERLSRLPFIMLYSPPGSSLISFNVTGIHAHDLASLLADKGICIRAGHQCALPLMTALAVESVCRASLSWYNTSEEIDRFISALFTIREVFSHG